MPHGDLRLLDVQTGEIIDLPLAVRRVLRMQSKVHRLPPQLAELLGLLTTRMRLCDMAAQLCVSERTVYRRQTELFRALGVTCRAEATRFVDITSDLG